MEIGDQQSTTNHQSPIVNLLIINQLPIDAAAPGVAQLEQFPGFIENKIMSNSLKKAEIVIYKAFDRADFQMEVIVEAETVWLNRNQIAKLFDRDVKATIYSSDITRQLKLDIEYPG